MKLTLQSPLKRFIINQSFGQNFNNFYKEIGLLGHNGIDFFAFDDEEVYASHKGRVVFAGYDGSGGLGVVIRTEDLFDYYNTNTGALEPSYFKTIYWHLKKDSLKVTGGQSVEAGQVIALADNTGRSTGTHLHFGLKPIYRGEDPWTWWNADDNNGYKGAIDPLPFFAQDDMLKLTMNLRRGLRGEQVRTLQKILNKKLGAGLVEDGVFGYKTDQVVRGFQKGKGLVADGIVGQLTRRALNET